MGKNTRAYIAVPSYFHIDPHFHQCLLKTVQWLSSQSTTEEIRKINGVASDPNTVHGEIAHSFGDSPHVGRSRNMLTRKFLESDCTDLLFIDSDLVFSVEHVQRILAHDEEVVGGIYFKKNESCAEPCINSLKSPIVKDNGLVQVAYIGSGFLRIKRSVFEEIIAKWGDEIAYSPDGHRDILEYNFWNLGMHTFDSKMLPSVEDETISKLMEKYGVSESRARKALATRWLSEDWWFCQKCMDLGIRVWADTHIPLRHSGNVLYPLKTQEEHIFSSRKAVDNADASASTSPLIPASA